MKKFLPIVLIMLLMNVYADGINVTLTSTGSCSFLLNEGGSKILAQISQDYDGKLKLSMNPQINLTKGPLLIGEIRFSDWKLKNITTPSLNPTYCGFAIKRENLIFLASNPVFCPGSQKAVAFVFDNNKNRAGIMLRNQEQAKDEEDLSWELDWFDYSSGTHLDSMFEHNEQIKFLNHKVNLKTKIELSFLEKNNYRGKLTYKIDLSKKNTEFYFENTQNQYKEYVLGFVFKNTFIVEYKIRKDRLSNYGGRSQSGNVQLKASLKQNNHTLTATSLTEYLEETGTVSNTEYELKYSKNGISAKLKLTFQRTTGSQTGLTLPSIEYSSDLADMKFENKKTYLTIRIIEKVGPIEFTISMTQDRVYSFGMSFET